MSELTIIDRIHHTIHSARCIGVFRTRTKIYDGALWKNHQIFTLNLRESSKYVSGFKHVRVLNIRKFS